MPGLQSFCVGTAIGLAAIFLIQVGMIIMVIMVIMVIMNIMVMTVIVIIMVIR